MTEKGCDNCYYTYFDERAYPCSLCIRGIERTDQWQPSRKTKADHKTEPSMEEFIQGMKNLQLEIKTEPNCGECKHFNEQALTYMKQCEYYFMECRFEPKDKPQTDCDTNLSEKPTGSTRSKMEQVETEPQTDCAWK
jgi:hypothetical protein